MKDIVGSSVQRVATWLAMAMGRCRYWSACGTSGGDRHDAATALVNLPQRPSRCASRQPACRKWCGAVFSLGGLPWALRATANFWRAQGLSAPEPAPRLAGVNPPRVASPKPPLGGFAFGGWLRGCAGGGRRALLTCVMSLWVGAWHSRRLVTLLPPSMPAVSLQSSMKSLLAIAAVLRSLQALVEPGAGRQPALVLGWGAGDSFSVDKFLSASAIQECRAPVPRGAACAHVAEVIAGWMLEHVRGRSRSARAASICCWPGSWWGRGRRRCCRGPLRRCLAPVSTWPGRNHGVACSAGVPKCRGGWGP